MGKDQSLKLPWPLVLASTSKYRQQLLAQLGWPFESLSPDVDENVLKTSTLSPEDLALELARLKAHAVFKKMPNACVIGSDQVCSMGDKIFSKPGTEEAAAEQLSLMQGSTHRLLTAVTIVSPTGITSFLNTTTLHMRSLTKEEIVNYVKADLPLDCAGSYKLEGQGIKLFERIEMSDHTAVIGLPLIELSNVLIGLGFPV